MQKNSHTSDAIDYRELLLAYLLEELGAAERESVDRRMLQEEEFSSALKEAEYDLLDAFAAGELTGAMRSRVSKALFLPSDAGVSGTTSLIAAARTTLRESNTFATVGSEHRNVPRRWVWIGAVAAAGLLVVGLSVWAARQSPQAKQPLIAVSGQASVPSSRPSIRTSLGSPSGQSSGASQSMPSSPSEVEHPLASRKRAGKTQTAGYAFVTLILPESVRGQDVTTVRLTPQTRFLCVDWPGAADFPSERISSTRLEIADTDKVVATVPLAQGLCRAGLGGATFQAPTEKLSAGNYLFRVVSHLAEPRDSEGDEVLSESSVLIER